MRARPAPAPSAREEAWTAHLLEEFRSLNIPDGAVADNLAAAIAVYCRQFHPRGLQSSDLRLLMARAFCALDDRSAAGRILESMDPHRRHVSRWIEILCELHRFPDLLPCFSRGIIRPADWAGAQLDRMWAVDFSRLQLLEADRHEITLYRSVRVLIERMYVFWDVTAGEGILGLKGLASLDLQEQASAAPALTAPDELLAYVARLFEQQRQRRKWHTVPSLLNLDL
jgi:hypothetical protein